MNNLGSVQAVPDLQKIDLDRARRPASRHFARPPSTAGTAWWLRSTDFLVFTLTYVVIVTCRTGVIPHIYASRRYALMVVVMMMSLWLIEAHRLDHHRPAWRAGMRVIAAAGIAGAMLGVLVYLFGPEFLGTQYSLLGRSIILPTLAVFVGIAILVRIKSWQWLRRVSHASRWLLLIGAKDPGLIEFWREYASRRSDGLVVLADYVPQILDPLMPHISGTWAELPTKLEESWSGIIISSHAELPDDVVRDLLHARVHGMPTLDLADYYERYWSRVPVTHCHGEWFALSSGFDLLHNPVQSQLKRISDIVLAGGLLLLAFPVMLVVAIAVKCESRGPIIFRQWRVGQFGADFTCMKFRSMSVGSEEGNKYTQKGDARITRLGRLLRKTRLDELPQLINVLRGDMSFIGPRAEWNELVRNYEQQLPYYHLRHLVRPGLTGWAQVNYPYGANLEDTRMKLEYDLYYIKFYSLYLDLVIILRTVRVCLFGLGAR